ncbi:Spc97 / Spc98 family protein [Trichomonas vaginalis G3]|uniref:Spc97 / Spc98 family protein n=1 Tax=Trichomonas vaginalis (strain ATCC PRA-98 / G3) TaxID=412133 RepID=A2E6U4_TRIV3|nr:microtubule nucleation by interphase microtubule organizing center [Trichomonas vaginalis G3]EAY11580.1 Spc97 / Spc98 family protein [Trichomonas vaginalis G3]KAI5516537.1 microtubule nucleation by interphase microtubule organizing center [Trichomonas vaginalis G3]|eukprot:XP_001323803.1 Spc97 / Spc98 family protein [Trichomonas vaginalis G3]
MELDIPSFLTNDELPFLNPPDYSEDQVDLREIPQKDEESALMKDLFSCLLGGDGTYIRRTKQNKYLVQAILRDSTQSFIDQLIPICDKFYYCQKFSETHYYLKYGKIVHTVCNAIRKYLLQFMEQVSEIEALPVKSLPVICINISKSAEFLDVLSEIVTKIENLKGPKICTIIHQAISTNRGLPYIREPLTALFNQSVQPILEYIEKWIYEGKIDDPYNEFFIQTNDISPDIPDPHRTYWNDHFTCNEENAPMFIPSAIINLIIATGKVQSIIADCNKQQLKQTNKITISSIQYEGELQEIYKSASNILISEMFSQYRLMDIFNTIWNVILFRRTDLFNIFYRVAGNKMRRDKSEISPADLEDLMSIVYKPFEFISVKLEKQQLLSVYTTIQSVTIKGATKQKNIRITSGTTQWEFFTLAPKVSWPISIVISKEFQEKYALFFRFILLWKRIERKFSNLYSFVNTFMRKHSKTSSMTILKVSAIRFSIHTFISSLINFISTSVIHPSFSKFKSAIQQSTTVEEIIDHHNMLQQSILKGLFFLNKDVFKDVMYIAAVCEKFASEVRSFFKSIDNDITTEEQRQKLSDPVLLQFQRFKKSVNALINNLNATSKNEASSVFTDFVLTVTCNRFYLTPQ